MAVYLVNLEWSDDKQRWEDRHWTRSYATEAAARAHMTRKAKDIEQRKGTIEEHSAYHMVWTVVMGMPQRNVTEQYRLCLTLQEARELERRHE